MNNSSKNRVSQFKKRHRLTKSDLDYLDRKIKAIKYPKLKRGEAITKIEEFLKPRFKESGYYKGTIQSIADMTGIPLGTVKSCIAKLNKTEFLSMAQVDQDGKTFTVVCLPYSHLLSHGILALLLKLSEKNQDEYVKDDMKISIRFGSERITTTRRELYKLLSPVSELHLNESEIPY